MSRAQKREAQPWLRYLVLPFVLILFGLVVSYALLAQQKSFSEVPPPISVLPTPTPTPTPQAKPDLALPDTSPKPIYICPANGWVNCMPILTKEAAKLCTSEAIAWFKKNCPGFQGVAY